MNPFCITEFPFAFDDGARALLTVMNRDCVLRKDTDENGVFKVRVEYGSLREGVSFLQLDQKTVAEMEQRSDGVVLIHL